MKLNKQILEAVRRGILLALDDYQDMEDNNSISLSNDVIDSKDVIKLKYDLMKEVVDLGLPSGTLWYKYNLGVDPNKLSKPEDWYGNYYAWGEIIPNKSKYNLKTYQFKDDFIKYNEEDHLNELQLIDDPAYLNMHLYNFKFKMPTKEDFEELVNETNNELVKNFNDSGVNGYKFTSKSDSSKYIFLPMAGGYYDTELSGFYKEGSYWSSSLNSKYSSYAWKLYFNNKEVGMYIGSRCVGYSVRPVLMKK